MLRSFSRTSPAEIPENFISLDVAAGINGARGEKKMHGHPVRRIYRPGANERVYVSAVADRVNVGKDEGLRFSGSDRPAGREREGEKVVGRSRGE